jgi:hypothetical protein
VRPDGRAARRGHHGGQQAARPHQPARPPDRPARGPVFSHGIGRASGSRTRPEPCGEPVEADHRAGHQHERKPPPRVPVPSHLEPPEAAQPGQRPLHLPPLPPKPHRGLHPSSGDPRADPTTPQPRAVGRTVVGLVRVDGARSSAPPPGRRQHRRHIVEHGLEHRGVVHVGGGDHRGQRQPTTVTDQVELGPRLATIDRICAHVVPHAWRTLAVSRLARDQSTRPAIPSWSKTLRWRASNTPASAHSVSRRQQVAGEPQPSSWAGSSLWGAETRIRAVNRDSVPSADAVPVLVDRPSVRRPAGPPRLW